MKLNGRKIEGANIEWIVIPRQDGDLAFKATAILDTKRFEQLVPMPKPGKKRVPGSTKPVDDTDDPTFKAQLDDYSKTRWAFLFLETFRDTPGLEWETVDYDDPTTWKNFEKELKDSGFTNSEVQILMTGMTSVNSLNQTKIDEARARFLASLIPSSDQLSLTGGQETTQSGEPVKESA